MTTLYTIGYEGTDIARLVETLQVVGIELLVDVRALPLSRKPGFSKTALRLHLEAAGISYRHLRDLGDPKPGRDAARAGRITEFRRIYVAHLSTPEAQAALGELDRLASDRMTCILCFERDPRMCHRSIVAQSPQLHGAAIFDLYGDSPSRYAALADRQGGRPRQGLAAAE